MSFLGTILGISVALAQVGVGVGLGKVHISQPLAPGGIYHLPDLPVINTGEVAGAYQVRASYVRGPVGNPKGLNLESLGLDGWFRFNPQKFPLEPNQSQLVKPTLTLP